MLLCCVVLVQLLVHGFVLSYGVLVARVTRRFRVSLVEAGEILTMMTMMMTTVPAMTTVPTMTTVTMMTMLTMMVDQEVQGLLGQGR